MHSFCLFATLLVAAARASTTTQTVTFPMRANVVTTGCLIGLEGEDQLVSSVVSNVECTVTQNGCSVKVPLDNNMSDYYAWTNGCTGLVLGEPLVLSLPESWDVLGLSDAEVDDNEMVERQLEGEDASVREIGLLVLIIAGLFGGVTAISFVGGFC